MLWLQCIKKIVFPLWNLSRFKHHSIAVNSQTIGLAITLIIFFCVLVACLCSFDMDNHSSGHLCSSCRGRRSSLIAKNYILQQQTGFVLVDSMTETREHYPNQRMLTLYGHQYLNFDRSQQFNTRTQSAASAPPPYFTNINEY